jgi:hypothetical protein
MMFTLAKVVGRLHPLEVFFSIIKSCFFLLLFFISRMN